MQVEFKRTKTDWWAVFWTTVTLLATLGLFFWIADAETQIMHCADDHPGGPWLDFQQDPDGGFSLRIHSTDPEHPWISGFQFMLEPSYRNARLSDELASKPGIQFVKHVFGGYQLLIVFFDQLPGNAWPGGTRVLKFDEVCSSLNPFCRNGMTQGIWLWAVNTSAGPGLWYDHWRIHSHVWAPLPLWEETAVSTEQSTWSAAKKLYR